MMEMSNSSMDRLKTGTTTVAIVTKEGVVMGTEHRATMGNFIAHKGTQKLFKIDENVGMTIAGLVGDAQLLVRYLKAEISLYRLKQGKNITIEGASTLLANILTGNRYFPYYAWVLLGGVDYNGSHVYSIDPAGGYIEDKFVSVGSGSTFVYGVLEDNIKGDLSLNEAIDLTIRGISAAMKRDSASGDGISIATITQKEFKFMDEEDVKKRMNKLKLL
jgi:proteasome beta subunit